MKTTTATVTKATIKDVKAIHRLLAVYGQRGDLLARPLSEIYDHLRDFWIHREATSGEVIGCCALQFCWEDLAEIRSLAVDPAHLNKGIGAALTDRTITEAEAYNVTRLFTLTYRPEFFGRFGFKIIQRSELPVKIWGGCLHCVKFPDCDEIAMMKTIVAPRPSPDIS